MYVIRTERLKISSHFSNLLVSSIEIKFRLKPFYNLMAAVENSSDGYVRGGAKLLHIVLFVRQISRADVGGRLFCDLFYKL